MTYQIFKTKLSIMIKSKKKMVQKTNDPCNKNMHGFKKGSRKVVY